MRANHHIQPLESPRLALKPGYLLVMATLGGWTAGAFAADASTTPAEHFDVAQVQFNDTLMMKPRGQRLDLDRFAKGNPVPAGEYLVDLYVNETWTGRSTVRFDAPAGAVSATPCLRGAT